MKKLHYAFESKDVKAMDQLMADDFIFVPHQSGTQVTKSEMLGWDWWNDDGPTAVMRDFRVIYENDENGSKEALMAVYNICDGQVTQSETGATPLK